MIKVIDFNYFVLYIAKYLKLIVMAVVIFTNELLNENPDILGLVSDYFGDMIEITNIYERPFQRSYYVSVNGVIAFKQIGINFLKDDNGKLSITGYY